MTNTVYKGAYLPVVSGDSGVWGGYLNTTTFPVFDDNIGGYAAKSLSNVNVSLSATESQMAILRLTGTLSGNVQVTTSCQGFTFVENLTTGAYTVTITNGAGTPLTLSQGVGTIVIFDATNGARAAQGLTLAQLLATSIALKSAIYTKTAQSLTASGASLTIDCSLGMTVDLTLSANVTSISLSNWPATTGYQGALLINVTSTGSYTMTGWPGTTYWTGGVAPVTTPSGKDTYGIVSTDGGTNFRGYILAQNMS